MVGADPGAWGLSAEQSSAELGWSGLGSNTWSWEPTGRKDNLDCLVGGVAWVGQGASAAMLSDRDTPWFRKVSGRVT